MIDNHVFQERIEELIYRFYNTIDNIKVSIEKKDKLKSDLERFLIFDINKADFCLKLVPINLPSLSFTNFQIFFSYAHAEFFANLFRREDFKLLFDNHRNDILVTPKECEELVKSLSPQQKFKKSSEVYFFYSEFQHSCLICVKNNQAGIVGLPIDCIVFDSIRAISIESIRNFLSIVYPKALSKKSKFYRLKTTIQKGNSCAIFSLSAYLSISHRPLNTDMPNDLFFPAKEQEIFELFFDITLHAKKIYILQNIADFYDNNRVPMPSTERCFFNVNTKKKFFLKKISAMIKNTLSLQ